MAEDETGPKGPRVPRWLRDDAPAAPRDMPSARRLHPNANRAKRAKAHETRVAAEFGGRRLPASGALPFGASDRNTAAADVRTETELVQHKGCERDSIGVKREWLRDLTIEARRRSLDPLLVVMFERERQMEDEWVMMPKSVYLRMRANQGEGT